MKIQKLQDVAAISFIIAVFILTTVSVLGIWDFFDRDVITKSFQTIGLLAFVSVMILVSGRFVDQKLEIGHTSNPFFNSVRHITVAVLIISGSMLALLGVLAIWDVIADKDVLYKSVGSLAAISFSSLVVIATAKEMEGKKESGSDFVEPANPSQLGE